MFDNFYRRVSNLWFGWNILHIITDCLCRFDMWIDPIEVSIKSNIFYRIDEISYICRTSIGEVTMFVNKHIYI